MREDIADQWATELESGKWIQGREKLGYLNLEENPNPQHCCLGVLCEMAVVAGVISRIEIPDISAGKVSYQYAEAREVLPESVQDWAGMSSDSGDLQGYSLAELNDGDTHQLPFTFPQIAAVIRDHVEEL